MINEYYGVSSTPMDDYLAHYGVRGMKWGVRKAIKSGDSQKLSKQYAKAQKKLAKLEKNATKTKKYATKAALMGAGAAAAGSVAAFGPGNVVKGIGKAAGSATKFAGKAVSSLGDVVKGRTGSKIKNVGNTISSAGRTLTSNAITAGGKVNVRGAGTQLSDALRKAAMDTGNDRLASVSNKYLKNVSNNTLARIGAGAIGAGLAAGAARNAYRAKTAQKKADRFRAEMNTAFKGTQYDSNRSAPKKRRRK